METLLQILPYIFGGGGMLAFIFSYRKEKLSAIDQLQKVYAQFIVDTVAQIGNLKMEIEMLHKIVKNYEQQCRQCKNNENNNKDKPDNN